MKVNSFRNIEVFNTPLETGIRSLALLSELAPAELSLQAIIYLDHFLLHSGDFDGGPESIHPELMYRTGKILIRRDLVQNGLNLMVSRQLILKHFREVGILYSTSDLTVPFLRYFESPYFLKVKKVAQWVKETFGKLEESEIHALVVKNIDRWGSEFHWEDSHRSS